MQPIEIIVIVLVCLFVVGMIIGYIIKKKKHKNSSCSGGCGSCPYCSGCETAKNKSTEHTKNK